MDTVTTNEWTNAEFKKPWKDRLVSCRMSDGFFIYAKWNGMYWVGQDDKKVVETIQSRVTHFYIFEKFNENDIL